jgi:acyl carrier protein
MNEMLHPSPTQVEQLTVQWVGEILDEPGVAAEDNFLELGGHSVLAVELAGRAQQHFGAEYDLLVLFERDLATAAAELAARLSRDGTS